MNRAVGQILDGQPAPVLIIAGGLGSRSEASHSCMRPRLTGHRGMSKAGAASWMPSGWSKSQLRSTT